MVDAAVREAGLWLRRCAADRLGEPPTRPDEARATLHDLVQPVFAVISSRRPRRAACSDRRKLPTRRQEQNRDRRAAMPLPLPLERRARSTTACITLAASVPSSYLVRPKNCSCAAALPKASLLSPGPPTRSQPENAKKEIDARTHHFAPVRNRTFDGVSDYGHSLAESPRRQTCITGQIFDAVVPPPRGHRVFSRRASRRSHVARLTLRVPF